MTICLHCVVSAFFRRKEGRGKHLITFLVTTHSQFQPYRIICALNSASFISLQQALSYFISLSFFPLPFVLVTRRPAKDSPPNISSLYIYGYLTWADFIASGFLWCFIILLEYFQFNISAFWIASEMLVSFGFLDPLFVLYVETWAKNWCIVYHISLKMVFCVFSTVSLLIYCSLSVLFDHHLITVDANSSVLRLLNSIIYA